MVEIQALVEAAERILRVAGEWEARIIEMDRTIAAVQGKYQGSRTDQALQKVVGKGEEVKLKAAEAGSAPDNMQLSRLRGEIREIVASMDKIVKWVIQGVIAIPIPDTMIAERVAQVRKVWKSATSSRMAEGNQNRVVLKACKEALEGITNPQRMIEIISPIFNQETDRFALNVLEGRARKMKAGDREVWSVEQLLEDTAKIRGMVVTQSEMSDSDLKTAVRERASCN